MADTKVVVIGENVKILPKVNKSRIPFAKESKQEKKELSNQSGDYIEPRYSFDDLLDFLEYNGWHGRCVHLKAALIGGLGWELVTDDDNKEPDDAHKEIMALLDRPDDEEPTMTFDEIVNRFLIDYNATGNGMFEISRTALNKIGGFYHVPVRDMRRDADFKGYVQDKIITRVNFDNFSLKDKSDKNQILHYLKYDPQDTYYGLPAWVGSLATIVLDRKAVEYNANLFANGMMAKTAITITGGTFDKEVIAKIKTFVEENRGTDSAGKVLVLMNRGEKSTITIAPLTKDNKEGDYNQTRKDNRDEIIAAHGVPPRMVGVVSAGQLGGGGEVSQQMRVFKDNEINPEQKKVETFFNRTIMATFGDHKWRLKFGEMDLADKQLDTQIQTDLVNARITWPQVARKELGLADEDGPIILKLADDEDPEVVAEKMAATLAKMVDKLEKMTNARNS